MSLPEFSKQNRRPLEGASDLCRLNASELARAFAAKTLSPVEVAQAALDRAEEINPRFVAFTSIDHEGALAAAKSSEDRWRKGTPASSIDGVPTTIKDIVWVAGKKISYGSVASEPVFPTHDAPAVARLKQAGATILGLTTTPEFGWKAVTDSLNSGVTCNPWNDALTSGGSRGGAAVASATGAGVLHLGTDGGGSIRIPASFTGIVGHKPSFGKVAAFPPSAFGTLAHIGPMARTVQDAKLMLDAMSGRDRLDWHQPPLEYPKAPLRAISLKGVRIGYWRTPPCGIVDPEVGRACDKLAERLSQSGALVEALALPDMDLLSVFNVLWLSGAAKRLRAAPANLRDLVDPGLLKAVATAQSYSAMDYVEAQTLRAEFGVWMEQIFDRLDVVVSPAVSIPAFAKGHDVPPGSGQTLWTEWAGFSFPVNLSQQPACVVPCDQTEDGRPIGLQIIGPRGADDPVLEFALASEAILGRI